MVPEEGRITVIIIARIAHIVILVQIVKRDAAQLVVGNVERTAKEVV